MKNKIFASFMMMLFPISLISAFLILKPDSFLGILLAVILSLLLWFVLHSIILLISFIIFSTDNIK